MAKPTKESTEGLPAWLVEAKASRMSKRPVKAGHYLSEEGAKKLRVASVVEGLDQSTIVDALLRTSLSSYRAFSGRPGQGAGVGDADAPPDD